MPVMDTRFKGQAGFNLVEIMIVVFLIGLLATIAIPNFIRTRTTAQANVCINNLRAIDYAIQQWALEQKQAPNSPVQFSDISAYLKKRVLCPSGGSTFADSYSISIVGAEPNCQRVPGSHLIAQSSGVVASISGDPAGGSGSSSSASSQPTSASAGDAGDGGSSGTASSSKPSRGNGKGNGKGNGNQP